MEEREYLRVGNSLQTTNLIDCGQAELRVQFEDETLLPEAKSFLDTINQYIRTTNAKLLDQETMEYGFWQIQFRSLHSKLLEVWERTSGGESYQAGASLALTYWRQQNELCKGAGTAFDPAHAGKLVAVTRGVLEGQTPTNGERYASDGEMSGWYVYSSDYSGKVEDFQILHLYHLARQVPRVVKFLALPIGYGFCLNHAERIFKIESIVEGDNRST